MLTSFVVNYHSGSKTVEIRQKSYANTVTVHIGNASQKIGNIDDFYINELIMFLLEINLIYILNTV